MPIKPFDSLATANKIFATRAGGSSNQKTQNGGKMPLDELAYRIAEVVIFFVIIGLLPKACRPSGHQPPDVSDHSVHSFVPPNPIRP